MYGRSFASFIVAVMFAGFAVGVLLGFPVAYLARACT